MACMFDLCDLGEIEGVIYPEPTPQEKDAAELTQWADGVVSQAAERTKTVSATTPTTIGNAVIWDIETGPRPWEEIERFFTPPDHPGEFDPSTVKYGNLKDPAKRIEKSASAKAAHAALVGNWQSAADSAREEFVSRAALSPITGRVLLIGCLVNGKEIMLSDDSEADMLSAFWDLVENWLAAKTPMIGHNSASFDIPFMVRRSWALGVPVPREVRQGR